MQDRIKFKTDYIYTDRETKARFVYEKYKSILKGKILDVGADQCSLRKHLPEDVEYTGIGLGGNPDLISIDLEKEKIPFPDNSFDCVLCLDVLEHLENIHDIFDNLCKITKKWLVVSLPNPWAVFMDCLQKSKYKEDRNIKFYGLTEEREDDRHKWFFSSSEANAFVRHKADKNNMELCDLYIENESRDGLFTPRNWKDKIRLKLITKARRLLFREDLHFPDLYEGTQWYVLRK
jgi:SAM-dependent methyltransferase